MKNKHIPSILTTAVLCALLSFGGIRCLSTAFAIDLSPALLMLNCCIWALAGCILLAQPKGGRWLLCGLVLLENINDETFSVEKIVQFYQGHRDLDEAFHWGLSWTAGRK